uniref:Uncharacterized protein n=1 Tax=Anguilla anguilla TaxID=7936 RepID=A0A0E9X849_ANGAN
MLDCLNGVRCFSIINGRSACMSFSPFPFAVLLMSCLMDVAAITGHINNSHRGLITTALHTLFPCFCLSLRFTTP